LRLLSRSASNALPVDLDCIPVLVAEVIALAAYGIELPMTLQGATTKSRSRIFGLQGFRSLNRRFKCFHSSVLFH
jgi:hypothetical protein